MRRFASLVLILLAGCKKDEVPAPPPAVEAPPVDHLAPGELIEGKEKAFGIVLPRGAIVERAFPDVVYVRLTLPPDSISNYLRGRVRDGTVSAGAGRTVFDNVKSPEQPPRILHIRVDPGNDGTGTRLEMRDATPPPTDNLPDEESRWRAAGLKPNGEMLDTKHIQ